MELVHDDFADGGLVALAKRDVCENLGGATEDGSVAIDGGVAGAKSDIIRAEFAAEGDKFLIDKRLDGAGIDGAFGTLRERLEIPCNAAATSDLPEPVGVLRMTFFSSKSSRMADSWAG